MRLSHKYNLIINKMSQRDLTDFLLPYENNDTYNHVSIDKTWYIPDGELKTFHKLYPENKALIIQEIRQPGNGPVAIEFNLPRKKIKAIKEMLLKILLELFGKKEFTYVISRYNMGFRIQFPFVVCSPECHAEIKRRLVRSGLASADDYDDDCDWVLYSVLIKIIEMGNSNTVLSHYERTPAGLTMLLALLNKTGTAPSIPKQIIPIANKVYCDNDVKMLLGYLSVSRKENEKERIEIGAMLHYFYVSDMNKGQNYFDMWVAWVMLESDHCEEELVSQKTIACKAQWGKFGCDIEAIQFDDLENLVKEDNPVGYDDYQNACLSGTINDILGNLTPDYAKMANMYLSITKRVTRVSNASIPYTIHMLDSNMLYEQIEFLVFAKRIGDDIRPYLDMFEIPYRKKYDSFPRDDTEIKTVKEKKEKKAAGDMLSNIGFVRSKLSHLPFISAIAKIVCLHIGIYVKNFSNSLDTCGYIINFLNVKVSLKTGESGPRTSKDNCSKHVNATYSVVENADIKSKLNDKMLKICDNDKSKLEMSKELLGFRLSGMEDRFLEMWECVQLDDGKKQKLSEMCDLYAVDMSQEHKLGVFGILLPYSIGYYANGFVLNIEPKKTKKGVEKKPCLNASPEKTAYDDDIASFLEECYEKTGNKNDRVNKDVFLKAYCEYADDTTMDWDTLLSAVNELELGYVYRKDLRDSKSKKSKKQKTPKGCFMYLKKKE